tara:strand:- start:5524 stop:6108 length:585 start_codon:yes stop_codon:yes gene_type:complete
MPTLILSGYVIDKVDNLQESYEVYPESLLGKMCTSAPGVKRTCGNVLGWYKLLKRVTYYGPQPKWLTLSHALELSGSSGQMSIQPVHLKAELTIFLSFVFLTVMRPVPDTLNPEAVQFFKHITHEHDLAFPTYDDIYTFETRRRHLSKKDPQLTPSETANPDEMDRNEAYFNKAYALATVNRILFATEKGAAIM